MTDRIPPSLTEIIEERLEQVVKIHPEDRLVFITTASFTDQEMDLLDAWGRVVGLRYPVLVIGNVDRIVAVADADLDAEMDVAEAEVIPAEGSVPYDRGEWEERDLTVHIPVEEEE